MNVRSFSISTSTFVYQKCFDKDQNDDEKIVNISNENLWFSNSNNSKILLCLLKEMVEPCKYKTN